MDWNHEGRIMRLEAEVKRLAKEARRRARNAAQKPGATRKIEDKRRKPVKHRKPLREDQ